MPSYNNYYQQYPYQFQQPYMGTQSSSSSSTGPTGIIWVQGEAGAKSYLVAPNTTVQLWDSESQTIYLKSADATGMPSIKTLDYTIRDANAPIQNQLDTSKFVTWDALEEKLNALRYNKTMQRKENTKNE